jgi:gamma-glutamyltranspeptidase
MDGQIGSARRSVSTTPSPNSAADVGYSRAVERTLASSGEAWAIATPHSAASETGAAAFEAGGNAVDAALAAAVTLAVAYPHNCAVGGDLFALVRRPDGDVIAINASGAAPAGLTIDSIHASDGSFAERGPFTITVPGVVGGWDALSELGSRFGFRNAFEPAIGFAANGLPVARSLAAAISDDKEILLSDPGCARTFYPRGRPLREGDSLRQPALAHTLAALANEGPSAIYGGQVGRSWIHTLNARGSPMTLRDLEAYRAEVTQPLVGRYRDLEVFVSPPNSQGFVLLEVLATIERLGLDPDPLGVDAPILAEVFRRTSADRARFLADPRRVPVPIDALLSEENLTRIGEDVHRGVGSTRLSPPPSGDTVALVAADREGWAVSVIQSLFDSFGSGVLDQGTGVIFHNRGAGFSLDPASPNVLDGMKRPMHTLVPVIALRRGALAAACGSMGGGGQPQINAMSLMRRFGLGMETSHILQAPRWLLGGMGVEAHSTVVEAESRVSPRTISSLHEAGFRVNRLDEWSEEVGQANVIFLDDGSFEVATDRRGDGSALAG